jgi:ATP-dependent DNA ligase
MALHRDLPHSRFDCYCLAYSRRSGRLRCRSCVIDGEVAIVDHEGRAVFDRLQQGSRIKPEANLFALDLIELNGQDLKREPCSPARPCS